MNLTSLIRVVVSLTASLTLTISAAVANTISQSAQATASHSRAFNVARDYIVNNYSDVTKDDDRLGIIGTKVAITDAYLVPSIDFFSDVEQHAGHPIVNDFRDAAFLCVSVANLSSQPLLVTAMKLDVHHAGRLGLGPGITGRCPSEDVADVTPECVLQPGQSRKWLLDKAIVIPGFLNFLKGEQNDLVFDVSPKRTTDDFVIQRFNRFLQSSIGTAPILEVSIFELNYKPVLRGFLELARGDDLFAHRPRLELIGGVREQVYPLQHDALLGEALSQIKEGRSHPMGDACH